MAVIPTLISGYIPLLAPVFILTTAWLASVEAVRTGLGRFWECCKYCVTGPGRLIGKVWRPGD